MKTKCALVQMSFVDDASRNVERACDRIREAGAEGAKIICLPELATTIFFPHEMDPRHLELAEPVPGPLVDQVAAAAAAADAYVIFPLYERADDRQLYNTALVIDRGGEIVGKYRKNVIPIMKSEIDSLEKYYFRPGNLGYPVFETDLGVTIGITICYERHFPEGPRCLALAGADVIFVPTATPVGREMWEVELRAMAIANQLWVGGVNRVGQDRGGADWHFYGSSLFAAPDGEVVAQAGDSGEEIVYATVDTDKSNAFREKWGFFRDRRPELYRAIVDA